MHITGQQLTSIIGKKFDQTKTDQIADSLNKTFDKYQINTPLRAAHFLAQVLHESGCFRFNEEIASGDAYDTRVDLGNTPEIDGDGRKYKGRGYIQITGTTNYKAVSLALGYDFFKDPEKLEEAPYNCLSAGWYWNSRNLNRFADVSDINTITKKINGGYKGLAERKVWFSKIASIIL